MFLRRLGFPSELVGFVPVADDQRTKATDVFVAAMFFHSIVDGFGLVLCAGCMGGVVLRG